MKEARSDSTPRPRSASPFNTMKFYLALFTLFALLSVVLANESAQRDTNDVCYLCAKSYVDCFMRFGLAGCTDKSAEHYTYCRECTGIDPVW